MRLRHSTYRIRLGHRKTFALVDAHDVERVNQFQWWPRLSKNTTYAYTDDKRLGKKWRWLHRFILNAPITALVDHRSGNGLDNRRSNLRMATPVQNSQNQWIQEDRRIPKTSRFKGVCWSDGADAWVANATVNGTKQFLGAFSEEVEAAEAYDKAVLSLFGEFARTNAMMGLYEWQQPIERNALDLEGVPSVLTPVQRAEKEWHERRMAEGRIPFDQPISPRWIMGRRRTAKKRKDLPAPVLPAKEGALVWAPPTEELITSDPGAS